MGAENVTATDRRPVRCHCGRLLFTTDGERIFIRGTHGHGEVHAIEIRIEDLDREPEPNYGRTVVRLR